MATYTIDNITHDSILLTVDLGDEFIKHVIEEKTVSVLDDEGNPTYDENGVEVTTIETTDTVVRSIFKQGIINKHLTPDDTITYIENYVKEYVNGYREKLKPEEPNGLKDLIGETGEV